MRLKTWVAAGVVLSGALALAGGCGGGNSAFSSDAGGASGNEAGSPGSGDTTTCRRTSECGDQVCSPDGVCVDCYEDNDCKAGQHCASEHCVTDASNTGGAPSDGGAGPGPVGGTSSHSNAGDTSNMGGDPGIVVGGDCSTAQVLFVIQRSGAMFELPTLQANYWAMVEGAIAGEQGAAAPFETKLDMGALFFVRRTSAVVACPTVSSMSPKLSSMTELIALFDQNLNVYMAEGVGNKLDAPTAEGVAAAASLLSGNNRHLILISTAVPDTCTVTDNNCTTDAAIKAVQTARAQGVTTHVVGLGDTPNLDYVDKNGYEAYLAALANAGAGQPVKMYDGIKLQCFPGAATGTATYSDTSGTAKAYQATDAVGVKAAVGEILGSICP